MTVDSHAAVNRGTVSRPRAAVRALVALGLPILLLFGVSGRWNWPAAWVYMALLVTGGIAAGVVFAKFQPGLAAERSARWRDGKPWDRPFLLVVGVVGPAVVQLVCGLDKRFGWSPVPVPALQVTATAVFVAGIGITAWAMAVNPFFSAAVRIQTDRGHVVVADGPYRFVRHPGYAGLVLATLAGPLLLGTLWGLVPAGLLLVALAIRTVLEDRTLRAELPGYAAYAARVRNRLIPGAW